VIHPINERDADGVEKTLTVGSFPLPVHLVVKLSKFVGVGAICGAVYALVTMIAVQSAAVNSATSSAIGYGAAIPINFILQRNFTFNSSGMVKDDLIKYLSVQLANLIACAGLMFIVVDMLRLHYMLGVAAGILFIPFVTYVVMDRWVFNHRQKARL
jgi:putative flippase GtrA